MENDRIKFEVIKKIADVRFKYRELGKASSGGKGVTEINSNSPPSVFIGSGLKYPNVNVGILSPLERDEDAWIYDDEKYWAEEDFGIKDIRSLRDSLLNSRFRSQVSQVRTVQGSGIGKGKFITMAKEIAMAYKPVDLELELKKKLSVGKEKGPGDRVTKPVGMKAPLKKARITSNVKIHQRVDRVVNDDLKAADGVAELYKNGFDEYALNKILSVGVLGLKKNRRLVPTRWSITTTDDIIGKQLIGKVRNCKWIENYELFVGGFMGNYYLIFLFPGVWSYELFELYLPGSSWNPSNQIKASTDYENYYGRKNYASNTAGGYYAARLPILKYLASINKQASVIAVRLETPSYWAALGVWVVRESVKKTMAANGGHGIKFDDMKEMLNSGANIGKNKFKFDCEGILRKSKLLESLKTQENLLKYI